MSLNTTAGDANADSYATLTEADTYFAAQGVSAWTGTDAAKENALRRGTQYIDNQYRERFVGVRVNQLQSLAWPRGEGTRELYTSSFLWPLLDIDGFAIDTTTVPNQIKKAAMEAALLVLTGVDMQPRLVRGNAIKSESKGIGPLNKTIVYQDGAPVVDRFLVIEGLLRGLVTSTPGATSGTVKLVRG